MATEKGPNSEINKLDFSTLETPDLQEACELVKANTSGKLYVIGGYLARRFAGTDASKGDIDFLAEKLNPELAIHNPEWKGRKRNFFPGYKFEKGNGLSVDISEISEWKKDRGLLPTPANIQRLAPFTHMTLIADVYERKILPGVGVEAILNKTTRVNNIDEARRYVSEVEKYQGMTVKQVLDIKAQELGFTAEYHFQTSDGAWAELE